MSDNKVKDMVKHPKHYVEGRSFEPKDVIRDWGLNFNLGSALKYIARAGRKGDIVEDLEKAKEYLSFEIEALSKEKVVADIAEAISGIKNEDNGCGCCEGYCEACIEGTKDGDLKVKSFVEVPNSNGNFKCVPKIKVVEGDCSVESVMGSNNTLKIKVTAPLDVSLERLVALTSANIVLQTGGGKV